LNTTSSKHFDSFEIEQIISAQNHQQQIASKKSSTTQNKEIIETNEENGNENENSSSKLLVTTSNCNNISSSNNNSNKKNKKKIFGQGGSNSSQIKRHKIEPEQELEVHETCLNSNGEEDSPQQTENNNNTNNNNNNNNNNIPPANELLANLIFQNSGLFANNNGQINSLASNLIQRLSASAFMHQLNSSFAQHQASDMLNGGANVLDLSVKHNNENIKKR
jgi:hypothetical protein